MPGPAAPALGQFFVSPLLVTTRGQPCVMPADSQGQPLWRDCLLLRGIRACPTSSGQWAVSTAARVIQVTLPRWLTGTLILDVALGGVPLIRGIIGCQSYATSGESDSTV